MHRNSHNTWVAETRTVVRVFLFLSRLFGKAVRSIMFGISGRQWVSTLMICALLWPLVVPPVTVFATPAPVTDISGFEPVNEELPIWTSVWREGNAALEAWMTPMRAGNAALDLGDDDDKRKKDKLSSLK